MATYRVSLIKKIKKLISVKRMVSRKGFLGNEIKQAQFLNALYFISSEMSSHFSEPRRLPDFANSLCHLAGMEKRKGQCI